MTFVLPERLERGQFPLLLERCFRLGRCWPRDSVLLFVLRLVLGGMASRLFLVPPVYRILGPLPK